MEQGGYRLLVRASGTPGHGCVSSPLWRQPDPAPAADRHDRSPPVSGSVVSVGRKREVLTVGVLKRASTGPFRLDAFRGLPYPVHVDIDGEAGDLVSRLLIWRKVRGDRRGAAPLVAPTPLQPAVFARFQPDGKWPPGLEPTQAVTGIRPLTTSWTRWRRGKQAWPAPRSSGGQGGMSTTVRPRRVFAP